jgi:hypothetical protein
MNSPLGMRQKAEIKHLLEAASGIEKVLNPISD